jgi:hypothetical protein
MRTVTRSILPIAAAVLLAACSPAAGDVDLTPPPLTVEEPDDAGVSRLTLSEKAASRLGIEMAEVAEATAGGAHAVIPYAAVLYDADGVTWTYTNPEGFVFVRAPVVVSRIDGGDAILDDGPPAGTRVVTVGGAELWGAELGVGGGH